MNSSPLVSIITAVYNSESYLSDCISSILSQSYKNFEYIIIDAGSTDSTVNIIKRFEDKLTYWVSEPDKGIYDAWNKGLAVAKGDWIAFVGADDLLYPNAIQTYVDHIRQHPNQENLEFVSSRIELVRENLTPIYTVGEPWVWERFKRNMITWHVGCFHSKRLFAKYGIFNPQYKVSGDYELLMRPKDKLVSSFVNEATVRMRIGGVSDTKVFEAHDETYRAKVENKILPAWQGHSLRIIHKVYLSIKFIFFKKSAY